MAAVDYEHAWLQLKSYVLSRSSHGKRDLLERMTTIEVDARVPEGEEVYDPTPTRSKSAVVHPIADARHG